MKFNCKVGVHLYGSTELFMFEVASEIVPRMAWSLCLEPSHSHGIDRSNPIPLFVMLVFSLSPRVSLHMCWLLLLAADDYVP